MTSFFVRSIVSTQRHSVLLSTLSELLMTLEIVADEEQNPTPSSRLFDYGRITYIAFSLQLWDEAPVRCIDPWFCDGYYIKFLPACLTQQNFFLFLILLLFVCMVHVHTYYSSAWFTPRPLLLLLLLLHFMFSLFQEILAPLLLPENKPALPSLRVLGI